MVCSCRLVAHWVKMIFGAACDALKLGYSNQMPIMLKPTARAELPRTSALLHDSQDLQHYSKDQQTL